MEDILDALKRRAEQPHTLRTTLIDASAEIERLREAMQEADAIMGHDDAETEWREKWAPMFPKAAQQRAGE